MLRGEGSSGLGRFPLQYNFVIDHADKLHQTQPYCAVGTAEGGDVGAGEVGGYGEQISVLVRPVPSSASNASLVRIACSTGGTVVGSRSDVAAASVTLSDFNPLVLRALETNVALNSPRLIAGIAAGGGVPGDLRRDASNCDEETEATVQHGTVHVRHLDCNKLEGVSGVGADNCRSCSVVEHGGGHTQAAGFQPREDTDNSNFDNSEPSSYAAESCFPRDGCVNRVSREEDGGVKGIEHEYDGVKSIEHGERFDVMIASDHM
ncbi:unnamed protein product [Ectocarpus sp. CCAP 1310/34]|nr:unnamed protein product [Ectocarpus sp. CCAP 1310/34]